jgi:hypothetical protein
MGSHSSEFFQDPSLVDVIDDVRLTKITVPLAYSIVGSQVILDGNRRSNVSLQMPNLFRGVSTGCVSLAVTFLSLRLANRFLDIRSSKGPGGSSDKAADQIGGIGCLER